MIHQPTSLNNRINEDIFAATRKVSFHSEYSSLIETRLCPEWHCELPQFNIGQSLATYSVSHTRSIYYSRPIFLIWGQPLICANFNFFHFISWTSFPYYNFEVCKILFFCVHLISYSDIIRKNKHEIFCPITTSFFYNYTIKKEPRMFNQKHTNILIFNIIRDILS